MFSKNLMPDALLGTVGQRIRTCIGSEARLPRFGSGSTTSLLYHVGLVA